MKKIVLYITVISLLCTVFFSDAGMVFADDINSDMSFAVNMGFFSKGQNPAAPITRAELAAVFYNIVLGEDTQNGELENMNLFSDVSYEDSAYANFAYTFGIMNGIGNGLFNPEGQVTYIQALKSMVCFLGYADMAEANGGYPGGYRIQAVKLGIEKGGAPSLDTLITYEKLASLLKLSLNVNVRQVRENEGITGVNPRNYVELYKNIRCLTGVVEATDETNVVNGQDMKYYEVLIDGTKMILSKNTISLNEKIGQRVCVYYRENSGELEVVHYEVSEQNKIVEIDIENISKISNGTISYYKSDVKEAKLKYGKGAYFVYNGTLTESIDSNVLKNLSSGNVDGCLKAVDNDYDNKYDYIFINVYETIVVDRFSDDVISGRYEPYTTIKLEEDMTVVNVYDERIKPADISEGDILNVEKDLNGKVNKITVIIDKLTGTLESVERLSGKAEKLTIDGITYSVSNRFKFTDGEKYLIMRDTITVYFDKSGKVALVSADADQEYKIGYLVDASLPKGLDGGYKFRIFTTEEKFEAFTLNDKVCVNDEETLSAKDVYTMAGFVDGKVVRQPVRYTVSKNKISKIQYCDPTNDGTRKGMYMYEGFDGNTASPRYKASMKTFSGKLLIDGTTVMFRVPADSNRDDDESYYCVAASSSIGDDDISKKYEAYGIVENSPYAKIIVYKGDTVLKVKADTNMTLVSKMTSAVNSESEEIYRIYGINNGSSVVYEAKKDDVGELSLVFGDVIRVYIEGNYVKKADKVFDFKTNLLQTSTNPSGADFYQENRFMYGKVLRMFGESVYIEMYDKSTETYTYEWYPVTGFKIMICDKKTETVSSGTVADIYDKEHYGAEMACGVLIHTRHGNQKSMIVYR